MRYIVVEMMEPIHVMRAKSFDNYNDAAQTMENWYDERLEEMINDGDRDMIDTYISNYDASIWNERYDDYYKFDIVEEEA